MFQFSKSIPSFQTNSIPNPMNNESSESEASVTIDTDVLEAAIRSKVSTDIAREVSSQAEGSSSTKLSKDEPEESVTKFIDDLEAVLGEKMELYNPVFGSLSQCIMRPVVLKEQDILYRPLYQSIGPHYKKHQLMEKIKRQPLFLYMTPGCPMLRDCIKCIKALETKARACYERPTDGLSSENFVQTMLIDSFLIISLLTAPWNETTKTGEMSLGGNIPENLTDLLLVENQIPFFIILKIWDIVKDRAVDIWFGNEGRITGPIKKVKKRYNRLIPCATLWNENVSKDNLDKIKLDEVKHVLDLYYKWNVPIPPRVSTCRISPSSAQMSDATIWGIRPATELYNAGIKFKPKSKFRNIFDISFENGILRIPTLELDSRSKTVLTNLVSHEMRTEKFVVTSYVFFMDSLINTKDDVALLQKFDVLHNRLESDEAAAAFINSLGQSTALEFTREGNFSNFYVPVMKDIQHYYASRWRRNWASFKQTYFSNPWSGISLFTGIFVLFLSCVQTYYGVFPRK